MKNDTYSFMVQHELKVNGILGRLLYFSCLVGPIMFILTKVGIFKVDTPFCIMFTIFAILVGAIQQLIAKNPKRHTIARYYGVLMLELLIGLSATKASVGIYISHAFATILSCLYVRVSYTRFVCCFSYVIMLISLYLRAIDQVAKHFITETHMEYFIPYAAGFTIEFVILFVVCDTLVKHEESLLKGQEKELLERLEAEEENKAKSDFLAQMSHEIRTPINAVLGMNEMILRETTQPEIENYARTIRNAGKSLLAIVNDILDFSKIQSGRMDIVPIEYDSAVLLRDLVELYSVQAVSKGLDFQYNISEDLPKKLVGDEFRIKQAAGNLISNAIKYTQQGFVKVQVDFVYGEENTGKFIFSVVDSGMGIKSEDIPKLFQSFGRVDVHKNRSIEGTGLGLKISKQLIEMMGGTLTVQSVYEEGSIFSITITQRIASEERIGRFADEIKKMALETSPTSAKGQMVCAKDASILIVDDNEMNLQVASSLLKKTQSHVDCVMSGKECLDQVKKMHYDLILLDHMMPEMDGIETLHHLREAGSGVDETTKIVVLTANAILGAREKYLEEGFDDYISKPIAISELERVLTEHLPASMVQLDVLEEIEDQTLYPDLSAYGIDARAGMQLLDDDYDVYVEMAKVFCNDYEGKVKKMDTALMECDMASYAILVHGLKSNARTLGANELGELAYEEEKQSKSGNVHFIQTHVDKLRDAWILALEGFSTLFEEDDMEFDEAVEIEVSLEELNDSELQERLLIILACVEEYQQTEAELAINELLAHPIDEELRAALYEARGQLLESRYEGVFKILEPFISTESEEL